MMTINLAAKIHRGLIAFLLFAIVTASLAVTTTKTTDELLADEWWPPTIITNAAQLADGFRWQNGFCLPDDSFRWTIYLCDGAPWWVDFAAIPSLQVLDKQCLGATLYGVSPRRVDLTLELFTGEIVVRSACSSEELLRLKPPADYQPGEWPAGSVAAARMWKQWLDAKTDPTWEEWYGPLEPPTLVVRMELADLITEKPVRDKNLVAEIKAWEEAEEQKSRDRSQKSAIPDGDGGMRLMMLGSGTCPITNETEAFGVDIAGDTNGSMTVTWQSCADHVYNVRTTEELSFTNTWVPQVWLVGQDGVTSWTDTNAPAYQHRFYRVHRASRDSDSDGDGLPDGWELDHGLNPLDATDAGADMDGDGYSNWDELLMGTSPVATNDLVTVYVDSRNTNGVWNGTPAYPFRYIQDAMQCPVSVYSNLAIRVRPGEYYETVSNEHYDFYGNELSRRRFVYLYAANTDWSLSTDATTHIIDSSHLPHNDVLGNPFGSAPAVELLAVSRARVNGFTIRGGEGYSILADGYFGAGILAHSATGPIFISNCIVERNGSAGSAEAGGIFLQAATNSLIYNTVVAHNRGVIGGILDINGARLWNCTVTANDNLDAAAGAITGYFAPPKVRNCVVWNNGTDFYYADVDYSIYGSNLFVTAGPHNLTNDPRLIPVALGNYRLQTNSPAINTGTSLPLEGRDLYGNSRPVGGAVDIGANEFKDTDGDGMQDDWELKYGLNPASATDATGNPDGDGWTNADEYAHNTSPQTQDTDGDGRRDDLDADPTAPELVITIEWHDPLHQSVWRYWINQTNDPAWINNPPTQPRIVKLQNHHLGDRLPLQLSYVSGAVNIIYFLVPLQSAGAISVVPDANATPVWNVTDSAPLGQRTPPDPGWLTTVWTGTFTNTAGPCGGFDDQTPRFFNFTHCALSVPANGTNSVTALLFPTNIYNQVSFDTFDSFVSVSPTQAASAAQLLQVSGSSSGTNILSSVLRVLGTGAQDSYTMVGTTSDVDVLPKKTNVIVALYQVTAASSTSPPTNVPSAMELKTYLDGVFGKQANVFMTALSVTNITIDYDHNENGKLDWSLVGLSSEMATIMNEVYSIGAVNVYYVNDLYNPELDAGGVTYQPLRAIFIQDGNPNANLNVTAHEIGHALGILGHPNDPGQRVTGEPDRLMWRYETGDNPCRLIRDEWRKININAE